MQVFHTDGISESDFDGILSVLRRGGVIAFPTDTAYGLGADPFNTPAVARIFKIKERPEIKPILLLVSSLAMAKSVSQPTPFFEEAARTFWPGPLTMIVHAASHLPPEVTAATNTIGLRWPAASFAAALVRRFEKPITATSANRGGMAAAVTAEEVRAQLAESVDVLVDGGELPARRGSTLLDLTRDVPVLLREGPIPFETLDEFFKGRIRRHNA